MMTKKDEMELMAHDVLGFQTTHHCYNCRYKEQEDGQHRWTGRAYE